MKYLIGFKEVDGVLVTVGLCWTCIIIKSDSSYALNSQLSKGTRIGVIGS
jgi:hypothetical protein